MLIADILKEMKKQLTNTPSFSLNIPEIEDSDSEYLNKLSLQIEEALKNKGPGVVFLVGPFGSGKTTLLHYFLRKHRRIKSLYKSMVRINTLDLAFLHLTGYFIRSALMISFILFGVFIMWAVPASGAVPFLLSIAYFFTKNIGNLIYILHEAIDNLFSGEKKLVILDDLERSSLSTEDQWALLANLWQVQRNYVVTLGYPSDNNTAKYEHTENVQKLGGTVINVEPSKELNYHLFKKMDPDIPFVLTAGKDFTKGIWFSLLTFHDMLTIKEQAHLQSLPDVSEKNKKQHYIHLCFDFLIKKLDIPQKHLLFDEKNMRLKKLPHVELNPEQEYFLSSFIESITK